MAQTDPGLRKFSKDDIIKKLVEALTNTNKKVCDLRRYYEKNQSDVERKSRSNDHYLMRESLEMSWIAKALMNEFEGAVLKLVIFTLLLSLPISTYFGG